MKTDEAGGPGLIYITPYGDEFTYCPDTHTMITKIKDTGKTHIVEDVGPGDWSIIVYGSPIQHFLEQLFGSPPPAEESKE